MPTIRTSDIASMTGLSQRYWQRRLGSGEIPGVASLQLGKRWTFIVDRDAFAAWWQKQLQPVCLRNSESVVRPAKSGSPGRVARIKDRWKPDSLEALKNDLRRLGKD